MNSMVFVDLFTFTKNASGKVSTKNQAKKTRWKYRTLNLRKVKFLVMAAMLSVNLKSLMVLLHPMVVLVSPNNILESMPSDTEATENIMRLKENGRALSII